VHETFKIGGNDRDTFAKPCQILVLSEDVRRMPGNVACQRILSQFSFEVNFNFRCWDFNHETTRKLFKNRRDRGHADIILLSLNHAELNGSLEQWLQAFSETRSETMARLFDSGTQAGPPAPSRTLPTGSIPSPIW